MKKLTIIIILLILIPLSVEALYVNDEQGNRKTCVDLSEGSWAYWEWHNYVITYNDAAGKSLPDKYYLVVDSTGYPQPMYKKQGISPYGYEKDYDPTEYSEDIEKYKKQFKLTVPDGYYLYSSFMGDVRLSIDGAAKKMAEQQFYYEHFVPDDDCIPCTERGMIEYSGECMTCAERSEYQPVFTYLPDKIVQGKKGTYECLPCPDGTKWDGKVCADLTSEPTVTPSPTTTAPPTTIPAPTTVPPTTTPSSTTTPPPKTVPPTTKPVVPTTTPSPTSVAPPTTTTTPETSSDGCYSPSRPISIKEWFFRLFGKTDLQKAREKEEAAFKERLKQPAGTITFKTGRVLVERGVDIIPGRVGTKLNYGDTITVEEGAEAAISLEGQGLVKITQKTKWMVPTPELEKERISVAGITSGNAWCKLKKLLNRETGDIVGNTGGTTVGSDAGVRG